MRRTPRRRPWPKTCRWGGTQDARCAHVCVWSACTRREGGRLTSMALRRQTAQHHGTAPPGATTSRHRTARRNNITAPRRQAQQHHGTAPPSATTSRHRTARRNNITAPPYGVTTATTGVQSHTIHLMLCRLPVWCRDVVLPGGAVP